MNPDNASPFWISVNQAMGSIIQQYVTAGGSIRQAAVIGAINERSLRRMIRRLHRLGVFTAEEFKQLRTLGAARAANSRRRAKPEVARVA
jgi:hypothetical protein